MILARVICLLPGLMLLPSGIGWMISPAETSSSFGFLFDDLSLAAQKCFDTRSNSFLSDCSNTLSFKLNYC